MTIYPQLVNISPETIFILQNMLIYALFIDCRESHLCTFCHQIHQCARIGPWGGYKWRGVVSLCVSLGLLVTHGLDRHCKGKSGEQVTSQDSDSPAAHILVVSPLNSFLQFIEN